jgi:hypothetical protein
METDATLPEQERLLGNHFKNKQILSRFSVFDSLFEHGYKLHLSTGNSS